MCHMTNLVHASTCSRMLRLEKIQLIKKEKICVTVKFNVIDINDINYRSHFPKLTKNKEWNVSSEVFNYDR